MQTILTQFRRATRRVAPVLPGAGNPGGVAALIPGAGAGGWELCRPAVPSILPGGSDTASTRKVFPDLESAATALDPEETFVLALPIGMGLVQRLSLPAAEPAELEEMARIQLEKILPYPVESIGLSIQEIRRTETDVVLAVTSIHRDRLIELCQPLLTRDCWPRRVAFYPLVLAGDTPADENTAFIYQANGRNTLGICEEGKLCFAQVLSGQTAEELASELPAVLLGAELEGVPATFGSVCVDERLSDWADTLSAALGVGVTPFQPAEAALRAAPHSEGDLAPSNWHAERQRGERRAVLKQRLWLAAAVYGGILLLAFLWLGVRKFQVSRLDTQLKAIRPLAEYSRQAGARWRTLSPAVEPGDSLVEALRHVYEALPPGDAILLTGFDFKAGNSLIVKGEAPSSAAAVDYTEKLKALPQLRAFHLEASQPTLESSSGRWVFQVQTAVSSL